MRNGKEIQNKTEGVLIKSRKDQGDKREDVAWQ